MENPGVCSIYQLASSFDGSRFAAAESDGTVSIWDITTRKMISEFNTPYDIGGRRLAIGRRGDLCAVASYNHGRVAFYHTDSGELAGANSKVPNIQNIHFSSDQSKLYCCNGSNVCTVLDVQTTQVLDTYQSVKNLQISPFSDAQVRFNSSTGNGSLTIWANPDTRTASISGLTFAMLDAAFSENRVCITQSKGPVVCFEIATGEQVWKYDPPANEHVLRLGYSVELNCFHGVLFPYNKVGQTTILRFDDNTGRSKQVAALSGQWPKSVFCLSGSHLVANSGVIISLKDGLPIGGIAFPRDQSGQ